MGTTLYLQGCARFVELPASAVAMATDYSATDYLPAPRNHSVSMPTTTASPVDATCSRDKVMPS